MGLHDFKVIAKPQREGKWLVQRLKSGENFYLLYLPERLKLPSRVLSKRHLFLIHKLIKGERGKPLAEEITASLLIAPFAKGERVRVLLALDEALKRYFRLLNSEVKFKADKKRLKLKADFMREAIMEHFEDKLKGTKAWRQKPFLFRVCFEGNARGTSVVCADAGPVKGRLEISAAFKLFELKKPKITDELLALVEGAKRDLETFKRRRQNET